MKGRNIIGNNVNFFHKHAGFFRSIKYYALNFVYYLNLLLVASLGGALTVCVNLIILAYFVVKFIRKTALIDLNNLLINISLSNLVIFYAMVVSYAEILGWELGFHTCLYLIAYYYFYKYAFVAMGSYEVEKCYSLVCLIYQPNNK